MLSVSVDGVHLPNDTGASATDPRIEGVVNGDFSEGHVEVQFDLHGDGYPEASRWVLTLNPGSLTLPTGFSVVSPFASSVGAGDSTTFSIRLDAASGGTFQGQLSFQCDDADENPFEIWLYGQVETPASEISVQYIDAYGYEQDLYDGYSTLDVGGTWLGVPVDKTLTIKNTGTGTLTLDSASLVLPVGFSVVTPFASTVAPGGSTSITFRLDASSVGPFEGFLSFGSNDADENPFRLTLDGQVSAPVPEMVVWYSDSYGYEQELYDGYGNVYFDSTSVGTSVTRTFRIANAGNGVLTLEPSSLSLPAGFSVVTLFGSSVAPGSSTTFTVRLDADWGGQYQGLLSLATNDADENPFSFWLFGDVSGGEGPPEIRVRDAVPSEIADGTGQVDFGATTVGSAVTRSLTIDNLGVSVLTLDPNTLSLPAGFSVDLPLDSSVAPGATTTLTIRLDAAYAGHFEGRLSFGNSDPDEKPLRLHPPWRCHHAGAGNQRGGRESGRVGISNRRRQRSRLGGEHVRRYLGRRDVYGTQHGHRDLDPRSRLLVASPRVQRGYAVAIVPGIGVY
jgi:hypothetical protein